MAAATRETLRRRQDERERLPEAREPLEVAWEREQEGSRRRVTPLELAAGRTAAGLGLGAVIGAWLDLSIGSFLALLVVTAIACVAVATSLDRALGRRLE